MLLTVKHKYKWKTDMKITVAVLFIIPVILWFTTNPTMTTIFGGISVALAVWIMVINNRRLNKGELTAIVDEDGVLTIIGAGLEARNNKGKTTETISVGYDQKAYNPTLILTFNETSNMRIPKRIALVPELNEWLRHNLPKTVSNFSSEEAIELFEEIFVAPENRKFTQQLREREAAEEANKEKTVNVKKVKGKNVKETTLTISDADRRKKKTQAEKEAKATRIAASIAALEAEEKNLKTPANKPKTDYTTLNQNPPVE